MAVRIDFFGDEIERLMTLHPLTGEILSDEVELYVGAATKYAVGPDVMEQALKTIQTELDERLDELENRGKLIEAQRIRMRTTYEMQMIQQVGTSSGSGNYP